MPLSFCWCLTPGRWRYGKPSSNRNNPLVGVLLNVSLILIHELFRKVLLTHYPPSLKRLVTPKLVTQFLSLVFNPPLFPSFLRIHFNITSLILSMLAFVIGIQLSGSWYVCQCLSFLFPRMLSSLSVLTFYLFFAFGGNSVSLFVRIRSPCPETSHTWWCFTFYIYHPILWLSLFTSMCFCNATCIVPEAQWLFY